MHRFKTRDADGKPVIVMVDDAVWAALQEPEPGWIQGRKGNGVSVLSFGAHAIDVERPASSATDAIMSERPLGLGRESHWTQAAADMRRTGDRATSALVLTWGEGETRQMALERWWQHRAGVEATRALWRAQRAAQAAQRAHGEAAVAARKAGRRAQAFARQREALGQSQAAQLTAAAVARGELTND